MSIILLLAILVSAFMALKDENKLIRRTCSFMCGCLIVLFINNYF